MTELVVAETNKRIMKHVQDVNTFFTDPANRQHYKGLVDLFASDVPWGTQEDIDVDPLWNQSTVKACVAGMREMANTNSVVVIAVGTLVGQSLWTSELSSGGWTVEIEPRVIQLDKKATNRKFHACKKRQGVLVMHHYAWVVAYRGYKNIHAIGGKSFGFFDTSAKLMSSVLSGCPTIEPTDRLLDENGFPCRLAEKHLGVIAEQIARFTPNCGEGATVMDFCSGTGSVALAGLYMNGKCAILNDKDEKLMDCAMARLRGFVYGLMQSSLWANT